jgi:hypothetical protein
MVKVFLKFYEEEVRTFEYLTSSTQNPRVMLSSTGTVDDDVLLFYMQLHEPANFFIPILKFPLPSSNFPPPAVFSPIISLPHRNRYDHEIRQDKNTSDTPRSFLITRALPLPSYGIPTSLLYYRTHVVEFYHGVVARVFLRPRSDHTP